MTRDLSIVLFACLQGVQFDLVHIMFCDIIVDSFHVEKLQLAIIIKKLQLKLDHIAL